jgi:hypothetical protein
MKAPLRIGLMYDDVIPCAENLVLARRSDEDSAFDD